MKKLKTSWLALLLCLVATVFGVCFVGCNKSNEEVEPVVITVEGATDGQTLKSYMDGMESRGQISFIISDGMVTEINGVKQTANCYWMLYTDDAENSDTSWGTCEYNGITYASSMYGADSLTVKNGCTYVWKYEKF